jgi:3D (Asp-Asp-Asp) domain-containing protein
MVGLTVGVIVAYGCWARNDVCLAVDGEERRLATFAGSVGELLASQGVVLAPEDEVQPGRETPLHDGMRVEVIRSGPVTLEIAGETRTVRTVPVTVGRLLAAQNVALGPEDRVEPALESTVGPGDTVKVVRVKTEEVAVNEVIPFSTRRQTVSYLPKGHTKVLRAGREGLQQRVWRVTYANGEVVAKEEIGVTVIRAPVEKIIAVGTGSAPAGLTLAARGAPDSYREVREMVATAYALHSRTATGTRPKRGTVAVDPRVIPLGTRLYVEGYGYGRAEDVGSAIKGDRIDVYFEDPDQARRWGRQRVKVYILD